MTQDSEFVTVVGAGLAGCVLACYLANRGYDVEVFEKRPDMRSYTVDGSRSINLALSERGIQALREINVYGTVSKFAIPMRGRMLHELDEPEHMQPYGRRANDVIYSVHRARLNTVLLDAAEATGRVRFHFNKEITDIDFGTEVAKVADTTTGTLEQHAVGVLFGADGAGSVVRRILSEHDRLSAQIEPLDHGYKELTIPPGQDGGYVLHPNALHVWPRGGFMMIALPNPDASFTGTLFLPRKGEPGFETFVTPDSVSSFFHTRFPEVPQLAPRLCDEMLNNPIGSLGTVRCDHWHYGGRALLIGDAAHAIVPFHGQGMNAAFEDCTILDRHLDDRNLDWESCFHQFERFRLADTHAIAEMALENYDEMRDRVRDTRFHLKHQLELRLEAIHPDRFIPRYSMVMFHRIPYRRAYQRGIEQARILDELAHGCTSLDDVDMSQAETIVRSRLMPFSEAELYPY